MNLSRCYRKSERLNLVLTGWPPMLLTIKPPFKDLSHEQVVDDSRMQLEAYGRNECPFNQQVKDNDPLEWWNFIFTHKFLQFMFNSPLFYISLSSFHYLAFCDQNIFCCCQLDAQWAHKFNYPMVQLPKSWKPECTDFSWYDTDWPLVWEASGMCTGSLDTTPWSLWLIPFRSMIWE